MGTLKRLPPAYLTLEYAPCYSRSANEEELLIPPILEVGHSSIENHGGLTIKGRDRCVELSGYLAVWVWIESYASHASTKETVLFAVYLQPCSIQNFKLCKQIPSQIEVSSATFITRSGTGT